MNPENACNMNGPQLILLPIIIDKAQKGQRNLKRMGTMEKKLPIHPRKCRGERFALPGVEKRDKKQDERIKICELLLENPLTWAEGSGKITLVVKQNNFTPRGQEGTAMAKNLAMSYLLDFYGEVLTEKQRDMMVQYYNDDLSLAEIADNFGITRQGVRDAIKRGEAVMQELEEKVGFAARYRTVQEGVARLEELARDIQFCNSNNYAVSNKIDRDAREMLDIINTISE